MVSFKNPIVPGFNPDPSICFVDGTFYLVTSSFLAFPAIPLYASHDLVNWTQISNVVTRDSQLDLSIYHVNIRGESGGVWAPTIRYHDGLFYVNVTCVSMTDKMDWHDTSRFASYIWTCPDPFTEAWSDPIRFEYPGFDTSLFWDTDGKAYVQGSQSYISFSRRQISQYEIDLETGKSLSGPPRFLWDGTGGIFPEAPHIFLKDGYYYLLIAEGGTYLDHSARMARAKNIWGPYDSYPGNPVLTPPPREEYVQTVGHADFVQDGSGNWWAVTLGTRIEKDKASPMGRETYLIEGSWPKEDWPSFTQPVKIESTFSRLPAPKPILDRASIFQHAGSTDFFSSSEQDKHFALHWVFVRNPIYENYKITSPRTLAVIPSTTALSSRVGSPSFVGQRQTATAFKASVVLLPATVDQQVIEAGFTVFLDSTRHAEIFLIGNVINFRTTTMGALGVSSDVARLTQPGPVVDLKPNGVKYTHNTRIKFFISTSTLNGNEFVFSYDGGLGETELGRVKAVELSVGFTGTIIGVYATGSATTTTEDHQVLFSDFKYMNE